MVLKEEIERGIRVQEIKDRKIG